MPDRNIERACARPGCARPAVATLSFRYDTKQAWLAGLAPERVPATYDLCQVCSGRTKPPRGWELVDERPALQPQAADASDRTVAVLAAALRGDEAPVADTAASTTPTEVPAPEPAVDQAVAPAVAPAVAEVAPAPAAVESAPAAPAAPVAPVAPAVRLAVVPDDQPDLGRPTLAQRPALSEAPDRLVPLGPAVSADPAHRTVPPEPEPEPEREPEREPVPVPATVLTTPTVSAEPTEAPRLFPVGETPAPVEAASAW